MNTPLLPSALAYGLYLHVAWALVAACAVLMLSRAVLTRWGVVHDHQDQHRKLLWAWSLAAATALWAIFPAPYGLSATLALAMQSPSLILVVLVCIQLVQQWRQDAPLAALAPAPAKATYLDPARSGSWPLAVLLTLLVLGWALVVDTLNLWPAVFNPALYAWGFTSAALWSVLAAAAVLLLIYKATWPMVLTSFAVLLVYALFRLPTGNVWDALLDPFVFVILHVKCLKWRPRS
jgi:hypothetical protein